MIVILSIISIKIEYLYHDSAGSSLLFSLSFKMGGLMSRSDYVVIRTPPPSFAQKEAAYQTHMTNLLTLYLDLLTKAKWSFLEFELIQTGQVQIDLENLKVNEEEDIITFDNDISVFGDKKYVTCPQLNCAYCYPKNKRAFAQCFKMKMTDFNSSIGLAIVKLKQKLYQNQYFTHQKGIEVEITNSDDWTPSKILHFKVITSPIRQSNGQSNRQSNRQPNGQPQSELELPILIS